MADSITMKLEGAKGLEKKLSRLPVKVAKKLVRRAVRDGAKVELKQAKSNALSMVGGNMGGILADSLKIKAVRRQQRGTFAVNVQHSKEFNDKLVHESKGGNRSYIPFAVEYGHGADKETAAIPFRRKAHDSTKQAAVNKMIISLNNGIQKEAKKK